MDEDRLDRVPPRVESSRAPAIVAAIVVIAALAGGAWYWWQGRERPQIPPPPPAAPAKPEVPASGPKHPIPVPQAAPLPALGQSDGVVQQAAIDLLGADVLARFFNIENPVRNFVVTVDNLPRETSVPARLNPVKPIGGTLVTRGKDASLALAPENAARYTPFVRVIERVDAKKAAALYTRFYPLFQQAYEELGYPGKYFNDRLVEAIDDLLAAPEPDNPPALVAPHVLYEYRDPELESRSAGQKTMMRMGRAHEATVKAKLRELRQEIVAGAAR